MLRALFLILVLLHGLIHLLGFVSYFDLAPVPQLSGKTIVPLPDALIRPYGLAWFITCALFVVAGAGFMFRQDWWPLAAGIAVLLSQALVIVAWPDAMFGTVANVIVLLVALPSAAEVRFHRAVDADVRSLLVSAIPSPTDTITPESIAALPQPVQRWLNVSGAVGSKPARSVRLTQSGQMRPKPDGDWIDAVAEQHFTVDPPGFVWSTAMEMMPLVAVLGEDRFVEGRGRMLITAWGLIPITDAAGDKIDQGTMLRYLAEICWFPTAAVSRHITWNRIDSTSARATLAHKGVAVSGIFTFNGDGDVNGFSADRYMEREGGATLERWIIAMEEMKNLNGYRIPVRSSVTWRLKEGDNTWFKLEVKKIDYW